MTKSLVRSNKSAGGRNSKNIKVSNRKLKGGNLTASATKPLITSVGGKKKKSKAKKAKKKSSKKKSYKKKKSCK